MSELKEKREKLEQRRKELNQVFEEAKTDDGQLDFTKVESLGSDVKGDSIAVATKVREKNNEMTELQQAIEALESAEKVAQGLKEDEERQKGKNSLRHPDEGGKSNDDEDDGLVVHPVYKSLGRVLTKDPTFLEKWQKGDRSSAIELADFAIGHAKAVMSTGSGWAPETTRTGMVVEAATRPIQILDLIPAGATQQAAVVYMEETTRTHAATETPEAGTYPEAAFELSEKTSSVKKIAVFIPVTDEQLEDVAQVSGYLDNRLRFGIRQRLDNQVINGDGLSSNLTGILNTSGILSQAKGSDPIPDAIFKAMTQSRVTGRAMPDGVIMHPNDWQRVRLLKTADGIYIWGHPSETGPSRMWGLPVAQSDALAEGTGIVGDFQNFCMLHERRGIEVKISDSHSDYFVNGKQAMRADMRAAFTVWRPSAFVEVTGLNA